MSKGKQIGDKYKNINIVTPAREYEKGEDPLMLRQSMFTMADSNKEEVGGVDTTAGLGGDSIRLFWKGRVAVVRGRDLLKEWVRSFDPESAEGLP